MKPHIRKFFLLIVLSILFVSGCKRGPQQDTAEHAFVSAPQVTLRDRVAAVYNKVGTVSNGDKVTILDHSANKRFAKIRTADGREGWMEMRFLVPQPIFDQFAKLAQENASSPSQATAATRRVVNLHVQPARDADALYQLKEGSKVQLLRRASTPKSGMKALAQMEADEQDRSDEEDKPEPAKPEASVPAQKSAAKSPVTPPADPMEDWWLVRDDQKRVGWMLGRMLDIEIPLEIAQYAEGQRIVASFVLTEVPYGTPEHGKTATKAESDARGPQDPGKRVPQYAVLMSEPKDGLPFDFNQLRIFTWNARRSRYETAYRERMEGYLPFSVGKEDFGKEGMLPTFTLRDRTKDGSIEQRKYKMLGVIVRRVLAPGEEKSQTKRPGTKRHGK